MASSSSFSQALGFLLLLGSVLGVSLAARQLSGEEMQNQLLTYHKGPLLSGNIKVNLIWYGKFTTTQRTVVADFVTSLSHTSSGSRKPSVAMWWETTEKYYHISSPKKSLSLVLGRQIFDESYSQGKSLTNGQIVKLASKGDHSHAINVVLTSADVVVDGFCRSRCGTHGSSHSSSLVAGRKSSKFAYVWVGNSESQCPGMCAWPFHQPIYGPQNPPLVPPNGDVGIDGIVINLASLLAGTATNPFGNGYFQGDKAAPLEAASACPGIYGKGAYPGYAGELLKDSSTGASFNAYGADGRKYLVPALYDPTTATCSTLV